MWGEARGIVDLQCDHCHSVLSMTELIKVGIEYVGVKHEGLWIYNVIIVTLYYQ